MNLEVPAVGAKPSMRGRIHQVAFFVAVPAGAALVALARGAAARAGAVVYAISLTGLFGASAAYHRLRWSPRARRRMRKLDHSMIYLLIAGSYTPIVLVALDGAWRVAALATIWAGAAFGIVLKLVSIDRLATLGNAMYIVLGWAFLAVLPRVLGRVSIPVVALLFTGGLLYTGGSVVLLRRKPNPNPRVFGFHEVWHSMGVIASVCHYTAILLLVRAAT